ncbi:MAG: Hsp20/alpha crystallin family protein [Burkholderiaceae bacterium]
MFFTAPVRTAAYTPAVRSFDRHLERLLSQGLTSAPLNARIEQDDKAATLQLDIPGLTKAQVAVAIEGHVVRISSTEDAPRQVKAAYELEHEIDLAASNAKLENGVLSLHLAKVVPVSKVTQLAIE